MIDKYLLNEVKSKLQNGKLTNDDIPIFMELFCQIANDSEDIQEEVEGWDRIFKFELNSGIIWWLKISDKLFSTIEGELQISQDITLKLTSEIGIGILTGDIDATSAYMSGDMQVIGPLPDAVKFRTITEMVREIIDEKEVNTDISIDLRSESANEMLEAAKLLSFIASYVYSQFEFNFTFNPDINILHGINGSGKTTVLILINNLISGNFSEIERIPFLYLLLTFTLHEKKYFLKVSRGVGTKKRRGITIESDYEEISQIVNKKELWTVKDLISKEIFEVRQKLIKIFNRIFLSIKRKEETSTSLYPNDFSNFVRRFTRSDPEELNNTQYDELYNLYLRESQDERNIRREKRKIPLQSQKSPIELVESIIQESFQIYQNKCHELDAKYQQESYKILTDFDDLKEVENNLGIISKKDLQDAELRINEQISLFRKNLGLKIKFDKKNLSYLIKNLEIEKQNLQVKKPITSEFLLRFTQFIKLDRSSRLLQTSSEEKQHQFFAFDLLKKKLDDFFSDTDKTVNIENGSLRIKTEKGIYITPKQLSSGEQQILILFTHLLFIGLKIKDPIFIYDEPELSLHLTWQRKFIQSILDIIPTVQIIVATHSPAIGSNFREKQIRLPQKKEGLDE